MGLPNKWSPFAQVPLHKTKVPSLDGCRCITTKRRFVDNPPHGTQQTVMSSLPEFLEFGYFFGFGPFLW